MSTRIQILKDGVITVVKTTNDKQLALNSLVSTMTANRVLRSNGTNIVLAQIDLSTDVTGVLPPANGGSGSSSSYVDLTTAQSIGGLKTFSEGLVLPTTAHATVGTIWRNGANLEFRNNSNSTQIILNSAGNLSNLSDKQVSLNNLVGAVTSGSYLRGNGINITLSTIQASDVPTLNQNTAGTASNVTGIVLIANGGTGSSTQNFVDISTNQTIAGIKTFSNSTASTSTTTGGTLFSGGVGIAGRLSAASGYFTTAFGAGNQTFDFTNSSIKMGVGTAGQDAIFALHCSGSGLGAIGFDFSSTRFVFGSNAGLAIDFCTNLGGTPGADNFASATPTMRIIGTNIILSSTPTSPAGLTTGMIWRNGNVLNIV